MPLDVAPHHDGGPHVPRLRRLPDWEPRLLGFLDARRDLAIEWGKNDAAAFAIGAVAVMTGVEVLQPTWRARDEATAALRKAGGPVGIWTRWLGAPVSDWRAARCGDVLTVGDDARSASAICLNHQLLCLPVSDGLALMPLSQARLVWRIPS